MNTTTQIHCVKCRMKTKVALVAPVAVESSDSSASAAPEKPSLAERLHERIRKAELELEREGKSEDDIARAMLDALVRITSELRAEDAAERTPRPKSVAGSRACIWCGYPNAPVAAPVSEAPPIEAPPIVPAVASVAAPV